MGQCNAKNKRVNRTRSFRQDFRWQQGNRAISVGTVREHTTKTVMQFFLPRCSRLCNLLSVIKATHNHCTGSVVNWSQCGLMLGELLRGFLWSAVGSTYEYIDKGYDGDNGLKDRRSIWFILNRVSEVPLLVPARATLGFARLNYRLLTYVL